MDAAGAFILIIIGVIAGVCLAGWFGRSPQSEREVRISTHALEQMTGALVSARAALDPARAYIAIDAPQWVVDEIAAALHDVKAALGESNGHAPTHDGAKGRTWI